MGLKTYTEPAAPTTTIIQQAPPSTPTPPVINELLQVKVGNISHQGNESKVELVSWEKVEEGRANFRRKYGADPPCSEQPTREQVTIFLALLMHLPSICIDVPIFVPWGNAQCKNGFSTRWPSAEPAS